ncbi:hypothetical protein Salat_2115200 [Sesamum alatum]|uniref:Uncharacterized protein n=1 Tax=Sesamum alatum TaxID=300844 RepID=A0AAE1Y0Q6_9LAMI|nr:hypothetical protein Salat_2115200 [Sesamum alatum]
MEFCLTSPLRQLASEAYVVEMIDTAIGCWRTELVHEVVDANDATWWLLWRIRYNGGWGGCTGWRGGTWAIDFLPFVGAFGNIGANEWRDRASSYWVLYTRHIVSTRITRR